MLKALDYFVSSFVLLFCDKLMSFNISRVLVHRSFFK